MEVHNARLRLIDDEPARRSLLGIDDQDRLFVLAVVQKENTFSGPLLVDLPVLFNDERVQRQVRLRIILNLDGGSASFFYNNTNNEPFMLSELTPIGSLLCMK